MSWLSDDLQALLSKIEAVPASVSSLIQKLQSDVGSQVQQLAATAAKDLQTKGLTPAGFVAAGKDILAQLPADAGVDLQDVFAILNAEVSYLVTPVAGSPSSSDVSTQAADTSAPASP